MALTVLATRAVTMGTANACRAGVVAKYAVQIAFGCLCGTVRKTTFTQTRLDHISYFATQKPLPGVVSPASRITPSPAFPWLPLAQT